MKKIYVLFTIILGICLISCGSAPVAEEKKPEAPVVEETTVEEVEDVVDAEDEVDGIVLGVDAEGLVEPLFSLYGLLGTDGISRPGGSGG